MLSKQEVQCMITSYLEDNKKLFNLSSDMSFATDSKLFGSQGVLDSISLVHLIVHLEKTLKSMGAGGLSIASSKAMSPTQSPFRTVETLTEFITEKIK